MDDAIARQQFYADGEAAYADTLRSNKVYRARDVQTFIMVRLQAGNPKLPPPLPFACRFNRRFDLKMLTQRLLVAAAQCAAHSQRAILVVAEDHC